MKSIDKGRVTYYLYLASIGQNIALAKSYAWILFSVGSKFSKPTVEVDFKLASGRYYYQALVPLSLTELNLFAVKTIDSYRLYAFDAGLNLDDAEGIQ